jgi:hypothetical protein
MIIRVASNDNISKGNNNLRRSIYPAAFFYWTMTVPAVMNQVIRMEIINAPR